jgi:hypothetical protein
VVELFPGPENTNGLVNKVTLGAQTNDGGILTRAALVRVRREVKYIFLLHKLFYVVDERGKKFFPHQ